MGTALNKILKDIIIKYKSMNGFYAPYVPGYDAHGLPIENAVVKTYKKIEDNFVDTFLREENETIEQAKQRINKNLKK